MASAYGLRQVCIANAPIEDEEEVKKYIGQRGAAYINEIIQDGDIIGVAGAQPSTACPISSSPTP